MAVAMPRGLSGSATRGAFAIVPWMIGRAASILSHWTRMCGSVVEPAATATPVHGGDRLPDQALDVTQLVALVRIAQRNGRACGTCACGAPDAVHIALRH